MLRYGDLSVIVHEDHASLAAAAASQAAQVISEEVSAASRAAVILASANSQLQFLSALRTWELPWNKPPLCTWMSTSGLTPITQPAFAAFFATSSSLTLLRWARGPSMASGVKWRTQLRRSHGTNAYSAANPRASACLGLARNGHLAFNDPPADPWNVRLLHEVTLDLECRMQQVGEGHFPDVDAGRAAFSTLTISALLATPVIIGVVPERRKAQAVARAPGRPDRSVVRPHICGKPGMPLFISTPSRQAF